MSWKISQQIIGHPTRTEFLGYGDEITTNTMAKMKDIINKSIKDYYVRRWAEKIIERAGRNDFARVDAIYRFLYSTTNYVKDPLGLELLKTPQVALQLIEIGEVPGLDCDDLTILSLSLLKSIGYPVALRAVGFRRNDNKYTHIYGLVHIQRMGWIPFDLVHGIGLGNEPPGILRAIDMEV